MQLIMGTGEDPDIFAAVAEELTQLSGAAQEPAPSAPDYAWTNQFGMMIQILGRPELADTTVLLEAGLDAGLETGSGAPRGTVLGYFARDRIVGALMFGAPRRKGFYNRFIAARGSISEFAGAAGSAEPFE